MATRLRGRYGYPQDNPFKVTLRPDRLDQPLRWGKPRMIFVCSMGDLFHKDVPFDFIEEVWSTMCLADHHIYIILTKRPERMLEVAKRFCWTEVPHVWFGVSVEDQPTADERIGELLKVPAAVRVVSIEPMLNRVTYSYLDADRDAPIGWLITGSETGPGARPAQIDWFRQLRDECEMFSVPFFLKQVDKKHNRLLDGREWNQVPGV